MLKFVELLLSITLYTLTDNFTVTTKKTSRKSKKKIKKNLASQKSNTFCKITYENSFP